MRFVALVLSVLVASSSIAATPPLEREFRLSQPDAYGEPLSEKSHADIATNGDSYFVVWNDHRSGSAVYGARVSADGQVLDPSGIRFGEGRAASVVWNGRAFVVVWTDDTTVWAAAVSDGSVTAVALAARSAGCADDVEVATNGITVLVATCGQQLLLLDDQLRVVKELQIASPMEGEESLAVASLGGDYLIASMKKQGVPAIVTQKLDVAGNLSEPKLLTNSVGGNSVAVASNGVEWLVVWRLPGRLVGEVVSREHVAAGALQNLAIEDVAMAFPERTITAPGIAWRGNEYLLGFRRGGWDAPAQMLLTRLGANGAPIATPSAVAEVTHRDVVDFAVRSDGSGAAVWISDEFAVKVGLFDNSSITTATLFTKVIGAALAPHEQVHPAITRVGQFAVATAWIEQSIGVRNVRLAWLGGAPLTVATDTKADWVEVAHDGNVIWVTWFGDGMLGVRRYTRNFVAIDPAPLAFTPPPRAEIAEAAAAGGGALIVLWRTPYVSDPITLTGTAPDLVAKVIRADGTTSDLDLTGVTAGEDESPVAVWDGARFFVAWRHHAQAFGDPPIVQPAPIRALHVTANGEKVEPNPVELWVADDFTEQLFAAATPGGVLLAWDQVDGVRLARVDSSLRVTPTLLPPIQPSHLWRFAAIAPLDNGQVDVYWSHRVGARGVEIRYERLSSRFESRGDAWISPVFQVKEGMLELDAVAIGSLPILVYTRLDDVPPAEGVTRLFRRQRETLRRRASN